MDDYLSDGDSDGDGEDAMNELRSAGEASPDEGSAEMATQEIGAEQEQYFDKSLAASHSYMGGGLVALRGRAVLEAGWRGRLLVAAHSGAVFPGETVPMLLPDLHDATLLTEAIHRDKLFGLLCPDATGSMVSGFGVVCEVYEAGEVGAGGAGEARGSTALTCKARATHRFRLLDMPANPVPMYTYNRATSEAAGAQDAAGGGARAARAAARGAAAASAAGQPGRAARQRRGAARARHGRGADAVAALRVRPAGLRARARPAAATLQLAGPRPAAAGGGGAVVLGGLQPDAVGARPPGAVRGGRRAAAPAHGAALHREAERAVLRGVRRGDIAARGRAAHVQRGRALQLHQLRRVHARHRDGVARGRRAAERPALRGLLLVPRLRLDHPRVRRLQRAPRLAVRRAEPQPAPEAVLRSVPQLRAAARRRRARPPVTRRLIHVQ